MFESVTNFTLATWTMNVLASGTEDIISATSLSLTSLSNSVSNPPYTNQPLTYSSKHKTNSNKNMYFNN